MSYNPLKDYAAVKKRLMLLESCVKNQKERVLLKKIAHGIEQLKACATANPVTGYRGLHQRNHDVAQLKKRRYDKKFDFYVIMIDIDHFGKFNKKYGEHIGNRVLKVVTHILEEGTREYDVIARGYHLHGEELQVILQAPSKENAVAAAERLRASIEKRSKQLTNGYQVTATFGITKWNIQKELFDAAQHRADRAMQYGKRKERNHVYYK